MASTSETHKKLTFPLMDSLSSQPKISSPQSQTTPLSPSTSKEMAKSLTLPKNNAFPSFSQLLHGVMAANSPLTSHPSLTNLAFQGQFGMSHQEALASVTAKATNVQMQIEAECAKSPNDPPPIIESESSAPSSSSVVQEQILLPQDKGQVKDVKDKNSRLPKEIVDKQEGKRGKFSGQNNEPTDDTSNTPNADGYSWRKYGQKVVKNSGSSRSYYRCKYFDCHARKKVQHLDVSGQVVAVVYKGSHNHDPPQNLESKSRKMDVPVSGRSSSTDTRGKTVHKLDDARAPTCPGKLKEAESPAHESRDSNLNGSASASQRDAEEKQMRTSDPTSRHASYCLGPENDPAVLPAEAKHSRSSDSNEPPGSDPNHKEFDVVPFKKRRMKESGKAYSDSIHRTFKQPKVVVQAARDVGISSDGYRWRKYGQKMVKGNSHPRSYYRCTSAGCPVRKHVEKVTDDSTTIMVTYEGNHDHDMPVPKKPHGSPSSSASVAATEAKSPSPSRVPSAQPTGDANDDLDREKGSESGVDKVLESARTLLSIGIELKS